MAKYIIDVDALINCLDLLSEGIMNSRYEWAYLQNVKELIENFPKDEVRETITFRTDVIITKDKK